MVCCILKNVLSGKKGEKEKQVHISSNDLLFYDVDVICFCS